MTTLPKNVRRFALILGSVKLTGVTWTSVPPS